MYYYIDTGWGLRPRAIARGRSLPNKLLFSIAGENMLLSRVTVTPGKNGQVTVRVQGRDDAGHIMDRWATAANHAAVEPLVADILRSMQVTAAKFSEEEGFKGKA